MVIHQENFYMYAYDYVRISRELCTILGMEAQKKYKQEEKLLSGRNSI